METGKILEANQTNQPHRAGFVSIVGKPNVGKSTLMNVLVGESLSIVTSKAQTTRHRIMGILNGVENGIPYQLVYSDTPGILHSTYKLHDSMMAFVRGSLEDADAVLFVTEPGEKAETHDALPLLKKTDAPIVLIINKMDLSGQEEVESKIAEWKEVIEPVHVAVVSALHNYNTDGILEVLVNLLPEHPAYFPDNDLTDRPERFFASEIIREKIFLNYKQEIPYSSEVVIQEFKEKEDIIVILADILVERNSQKGIIIGEKGSMLKKIGIQARKNLEAFFQKKVFLETRVKVDPDWRNNELRLKQLGYKE